MQLSSFTTIYTNTFFYAFSTLVLFYLAFTHIHSLMDSSDRNLGLVFWPKIFGMQTGGARDQTSNFPMSR